MDNKSTALGVGLAVLTVGLGYLGYTVMNNQEWDTINVEKTDNVEKVVDTLGENVGETLEESAVKNVIKESFLSTFWRNEFNNNNNNNKKTVTVAELE